MTYIPFSFDRKPLAGDGALVKEELPAVVAEGPQGGAVGDGDGGGGAIGGEDDCLSGLRDIEVVDGRVAGAAGEQNVDGLLAVEYSAGGAELPVLLGEEWDDGGAVSLPVGMEETLFERVEMILKFRVGHAWDSNCYTHGDAMGFRCGFAVAGILSV